jgi:hypothetical protein
MASQTWPENRRLICRGGVRYEMGETKINKNKTHSIALSSDGLKFSGWGLLTLLAKIFCIAGRSILISLIKFSGYWKLDGEKTYECQDVIRRRSK